MDKLIFMFVCDVSCDRVRSCVVRFVAPLRATMESVITHWERLTSVTTKFKKETPLSVRFMASVPFGFMILTCLAVVHGKLLKANDRTWRRFSLPFVISVFFCVRIIKLVKSILF